MGKRRWNASVAAGESDEMNDLSHKRLCIFKRFLALRRHRSGAKTEIIKSSCHIAVIVIEHASEPLSPTEFPARPADPGFRFDESASKPLMVSLALFAPNDGAGARRTCSR